MRHESYGAGQEIIGYKLPETLQVLERPYVSPLKSNVVDGHMPVTWPQKKNDVRFSAENDSTNRTEFRRGL